jgi:glyoxylase-like metal-dependent hydrolase (beta-lactamase superfamily II)
MKISKNCFAVLGLGYSLPWVVNSGFIIGEEKTLIVDSGPNYLSAQTIYGYAKNLKPENELLVVNTEKHFDHICGNSFFKEKGIKIFGHENSKRSILEFEDELKYFNDNIDNKTHRELHEEKIFFQKTEIVNPDFIVKDKQLFSLGGVEAKIIFTLGHTNSNISVYIEREKVLFCGDLIVSGYMPNLEAGTKEDWKLWIDSLQKISELEIDFIIPGHGNIISGGEVEKEIESIKKIVLSAIEENKAPTCKIL